MWLLGIELRISGRSAIALNHWTIAPAQICSLLKALSSLLSKHNPHATNLIPLPLQTLNARTFRLTWLPRSHQSLWTINVWARQQATWHMPMTLTLEKTVRSLRPEPCRKLETLSNISRSNLKPSATFLGPEDVKHILFCFTSLTQVTRASLSSHGAVQPTEKHTTYMYT